jgi:peptidoglycan-associated lipoprotein
MTRLSRSAPVLLVMVAALAACPKKPKPATPPPAPAVNQDSIDAAARERARQDSLARLEQMRRDSIARLDQMRRDSAANAANAMTEARNAVTAVIYFDYDRSDLTDAARTTLDRKIPMLNGNSALRIRISGHTDSRGSDEYNLALGQRRAAAAKRYLTQHGIDASRIDVVSRGEEQPAATGDDESSWSQNRRDEFEIVSGGDNLQMPR